MKVFNYNFDVDKITLIPISDTHIGSAEFSESRLKETIDEIKNDKDTYCLLNGDILDMCIPDSVAKGEIYDAISPAVALGIACKLFEPIKDKILMVDEGNHEARQTKMTGISPLMQFCVYLGLEDKYTPNGAYLFLNLKLKNNTNRTFKVYVIHGSSNSAKVGGKINKLSDYASMIEADIYIVGHSHLPATFKQDYLQPNETKKTIYQATRLFVNLNSYMFFGGYGEKKGYVPSSIAQPKILLGVRRKQKNNKEHIEQEMNCIL